MSTQTRPPREQLTLQRIIWEDFNGVSVRNQSASANSIKSGFREQKTVLLVNHAFARGTPAIFVIFVVSQGLSNKALVLLVRMQICHFRRFRQNPPLQGTRNYLPPPPESKVELWVAKSTVHTQILENTGKSYLP